MIYIRHHRNFIRSVFFPAYARQQCPGQYSPRGKMQTEHWKPVNNNANNKAKKHYTRHLRYTFSWQLPSKNKLQGKDWQQQAARSQNIPPEVRASPHGDTSCLGPVTACCHALRRDGCGCATGTGVNQRTARLRQAAAWGFGHDTASLWRTMLCRGCQDTRPSPTALARACTEPAFPSPGGAVASPVPS